MMDETAAPVLREALLVPNNLIALDLASNKLGDDGVKTVFSALQIPNASLNVLGLGDNEITNRGARHIATALKKNGRMRTLYLQQNRIGDSGARLIAEALEVNQVLTTVKLEAPWDMRVMQREMGIYQGQKLLIAAMDKNRALFQKAVIDCGVEEIQPASLRYCDDITEPFVLRHLNLFHMYVFDMCTCLTSGLVVLHRSYGWAPEGGAIRTESLGLRIKWQPQNNGKACSCDPVPLVLPDAPIL